MCEDAPRGGDGCQSPQTTAEAPARATVSGDGTAEAWRLVSTAWVVCLSPNTDTKPHCFLTCHGELSAAPTREAAGRAGPPRLRHGINTRGPAHTAAGLGLCPSLQTSLWPGPERRSLPWLPSAPCCRQQARGCVAQGLSAPSILVSLRGGHCRNGCCCLRELPPSLPQGPC